MSGRVSKLYPYNSTNSTPQYPGQLRIHDMMHSIHAQYPKLLSSDMFEPSPYAQHFLAHPRAAAVLLPGCVSCSRSVQLAHTAGSQPTPTYPTASHGVSLFSILLLLCRLPSHCPTTPRLQRRRRQQQQINDGKLIERPNNKRQRSEDSFLFVGFNVVRSFVRSLVAGQRSFIRSFVRLFVGYGRRHSFPPTH